MLFGVPVVQIVLFGFALTNEIKNSNIVIVDNAKDLVSQQIITKIASTDYFKIKRALLTSKQIDAAFKSGDIKLAIVFPENLYTDLVHTNKAQIQIIADASDPNTATTLTYYVNGIIADYQTQFNQVTEIPERINIDTRMLYNPDLKRSSEFCTRCNSNGDVTYLCYDDLHIYCTRKGIRYNGSFACVTIQTYLCNSCESCSLPGSVYY